MAPEATQDSQTSSDDYVRLHITPFNPSLLNAVVAPSIQRSARNISFHTLQTFPDQGYGFVELPKMEAEKIKKKLKGAILKGTKVRIEDARPEKKLAGLGEPDDKPKKRSKEEKDSKKRKRDSEALPGVELRDRKVKRGWTEPTTGKFERRSKDKDAKQTAIMSKYTSQPECLFKATLPANVASKLKASDTKVESNTERKKKKHNGKEIVVHEFAKTTKYASFLRGSGPSKDSKPAVEFVEGKGWVDEDGNVVENAPVQKKPKRTIVVKRKVEVEESETSSSGSSSSEEDSSSSEEEEGEDEEDAEDDIEMEDGTAVADATPVVKAVQDAIEEVDRGEKVESSESSESEADEVASGAESEPDAESTPASKAASIEPLSATPTKSTEQPIQITKKGSPAASTTSEDASSDSESEIEESESESSSDSSSDEESDSSSEADSDEASEKAVDTPTDTTTQPTSSKNLSLSIPANTETTTPGEVHPLEALYKRRKIAGDAPVLTEGAAAGFSFFGGDNDDIEEDEEMNDVAPMTPYTRREFESRGYRSAAPTPDTAHPNKSFNWSTNDDEDEDEGEEQGYGATPVQKKNKKFAEQKEETKTAAEPIGDFQKWFYENRGDTNRAWKKRRKVAAKESRQRENRKRGDRA